MKSVDKYQCDRCHRNLWSREQLDLHTAKCDGSHVERRGRKPGDNSCMVSTAVITPLYIPTSNRILCILCIYPYIRKKFIFYNLIPLSTLSYSIEVFS